MIHYKKIIFPVIATGFILAQVPAQAISAKEVLSMMQQGATKLFQPLLASPLWNSIKNDSFYDILCAPRNKKLIAPLVITGITGLGLVGVYKYHSLLKKNTELNRLLEKEKHEKYLALKKQQAYDSERLYQNVIEQLKEETRLNNEQLKQTVNYIVNAIFYGSSNNV